MVPSGPVPVPAAAQLAVDEAYQGLVDVMSGEQPTGDLDIPILRRLLGRNLNGVGLTTIEVDDQPRVQITPFFAEAGLRVVAPSAPPITIPRRVRGSLEGELIDAGHHYRQPALKLRERQHGRIIWCRVQENVRDQFARDTTLNDVWKYARVRLRGWIEYSPRGVITGMSAERIQKVIVKEVSLGDLYDPEFTGGVDSVTYIDRLRDGDLG
jgi:hypothetical protein